MTIANDAIRKAGPFVGNSITTVFAFAFKTFSAADLSVTLLTTATGVQQLLVLNSDYTVQLNANQNTTPGGTVTTIGAISPIPNTKTLTISGNVMADTQGTDLVTPGPWVPDDVENMVDRAMIAAQQLRDRAIKFPVIDSIAPVDIPQAETRAGRLLGFDAVGALATFIVQVGSSIVDLAAATGSSLVGFIQSGAGATPRTVQSALRDFPSIKGFGAVGDGVTSNNAAFTLIEADAGTDYWTPEGTYITTVAGLTKAYYGPGTIVLSGVSIGPSRGVTRGTNGAVQKHRSLSGGAFHEFSVPGASVKAVFGALSGEANFDYNMDYTTGVHRFYDNTKPALWDTLNNGGLTLQYAPASVMAGDVWTGQGSLNNRIIDTAGNQVIRGKHVVQKEALVLVNGANQNVALSSTQIAFISGPSANFSIGGIVAPVRTNDEIGAGYGIGITTLTLMNNTAFQMTINNNDAGSAAANRIFCRNGANLVLVGANGCVTLGYFAVYPGWAVLYNN